MGSAQTFITKRQTQLAELCLRHHVDVVRQLYGVMAARGAAGGFVVTSGRFTPEAQDFASGRNVMLIEGGELHQMLQRTGVSAASTTAGVAAAPVSSNVSAQRSKPAPAGSSVAPADPSCPKCGKAMLRRVAKQGANAGKAFWGCSAYPACRSTRALDAE